MLTLGIRRLERLNGEGESPIAQKKDLQNRGNSMSRKRCLFAIFVTFDLLLFAIWVFAFSTVRSQRTIIRFPIAEEPENPRELQDGHVQVSNSNYISINSSITTNRTVKLTINPGDFQPCHGEINECRRRLPQAIVIGVKKCGTGTIRDFLGAHPQVAFSPEIEIHYFDQPWRYEKGVEWYRNRMALSHPGRVTIEKTPRYFVSSVAPGGIRDQVSPKTKLIVLLRDPVTRAVSDYLQEMHTKGLSDPRSRAVIERQKPPYVDPIYDIKAGFEQSVLDENGTIKEWNGLINVGLYANHIQRWLEVFPRDQLLILDSEKLTKDPLRAMKETEAFLGLAPFFRRAHFHFSTKKGFHCLNVTEVHCMAAKKGRVHPTVDPAVLGKLRDFYKPHDQRLVGMLRRNFSWMT